MTVLVKHLETKEEWQFDVKNIMLGVADGDEQTILFLTDGGIEVLTPANIYAVSRIVPDVPEKPLTLSEHKFAKLADLSRTCNAAIIAGSPVTLADGMRGQLSLTDEDQINLMSAIAAVQGGALGYPYHLDGALCKVYPAADILRMGNAATQHKLYHTTYCNHLNVWVRRCETVEELEAITYGATLPEDLAANMAEVLGHVG